MAFDITSYSTERLRRSREEAVKNFNASDDAPQRKILDDWINDVSRELDRRADEMLFIPPSNDYGSEGF